VTAGELFHAEVREQPAALRHLLERGQEICELGSRLAGLAPPVFRLVGHGSSDNAAAFGIYAFALIGGRTAMRDSISLTTYYDAEIDFSGSVVIALSQSGRTPDVVDYVERARARGATTVAVTNDPGSALGLAADLTVELQAGEEAAVAATKTYTNQLAALVLLAAGAAGRGPELIAALEHVTGLFEEAIALSEAAVSRLATVFGFTGRMFVIGRGLEFATARELALKLTETCGVAAEPMTATELVHGPIAVLDPLFPVWAIASNDAGLPSVQEAAQRAREVGATVVASGSAAETIAGAAYRLPIPAAPSPLDPLLSIVPGQLFAWALASAKGLDPDRPTHLTKVTLAK
jgi:glucosamine--fructose-6-phosphate aminotransferase (isomerizing)